MNPKKIFIVEDDNVLRDVLVEKLSKSGYVVESAEDGEIAMQKLRAGLNPDLILLDILMPRKNGMEVMEEMNTDENLKKIPIIIISNSGQPVEVERAKALGARDFLIKAIFDPTEVLEKVKAALGEPVAETAHIEQQNVSSTIIREDAQKGVAAQKNVGWGVMVVEDDKFLRELFIRKLFSEGFKVENAIDAKGAFEILERWKPHIILLDLILPGVDGFEILARLKKDDRFKEIPVIVLSNLGQQEDIDRAMTLGAKDFMVKANFTLEEIIARVRVILGGGA
ncbi:MAG: response regulator [Minisyncoccota bacterium]